MTATRDVIITDPLGLHARPAAEFVALARTFASDLVIGKDDKAGNCKSLVSILRLGVNQGSTVTLSANGADEEQAIAALAELLASPPEAP